MSGLIGLLIVIILAFSFGFLISGDGEESVSDIHTEHEQTAKPTIWTCSMHPQIKLPKPGKC
ncbi:MAG: heavy metal-binding domain-containing protein, partial [Candidatus Zixiibacteriota bacterium]